MSVESREAPIKTKLDSMFNYRFGQLRMIADDETTFEQFGDIAEQTIFSWFHSYDRFLKHVIGVKAKQISIRDFPEAGLVITQDRELFRLLYHSPSRFDQLPEWVRGYVNQKLGLYVKLFSGKHNKSGDIDGEAHEFTHLILPALLRIPYEEFGTIWNTWINETFAVGLNQRQTIEWLKIELQKPGVRAPTILSILSEGIFAHDKRKPNENTAYQYCVHSVEQLGVELIPHIR